MLKLKENELLVLSSVFKVQFDNSWYFELESLATFLKEDLSDVESVKLPINSTYAEFATLENIEKGRKQDELSEFNKALLKIKKFKK
jgi:hypothetical protein